jgi:hypothetical protein
VEDEYMTRNCIKVYVSDKEYELLRLKADNENLTLSKYMKRQGLRENKNTNTKLVYEFSNLSRDFQDLLMYYDISDEHLKNISERIDIICQNL